MYYSEINNVVAESCISFMPYNPILQLSSSGIGQSCTNCINYRKGKCSLKVFDELVKRLKIN